MTRAAGMLAGVLVRRGVAAADRATAQAHSQVYPLVTDREAFRAATTIGSHRLDQRPMRAADRPRVDDHGRMLRPHPPITVPRMADAEIRLTDQVANGTMSQEIADLLRDTAKAHKSFIVMAVPRLAGKTTTMRAMLAEQPAPVVTLGDDGDDVGLLVPRAKGGYLVVPEISRGAHSPGYVWGETVRQAFAGIASGAALATALHAPDPVEAFRIICGGCGVPDADAARISVVVYIRSLGEWEHPTRRVVSTVHEIRGVHAGKPDLRLLFSWNETKDRFERATA